MGRYDVDMFDHDTFIVFDVEEMREICICGNYEGWEDAEERAYKIAWALNMLFDFGGDDARRCEDAR